MRRSIFFEKLKKELLHKNLREVFAHFSRSGSFGHESYCLWAGLHWGGRGILPAHDFREVKGVKGQMFILLMMLLIGRQDAMPSQCRLADDDVMITEKVNRFLIRMCRYILNERKVRGFG